MNVTDEKNFPQYLKCESCLCTKNSSLILNFSPDGPTHQGTQDFIRHLWQEIYDGYGFVPYIGAGFSVSAGIPVVWQFHDYLKRCIAHAVGVRRPGVGESAELQERVAGHFFNPRTDNWPAFGDIGPAMQNWQDPVLHRFRDIQKYLDDNPSLKDGDRRAWTRYKSICQEAFGAMADWCSSLQFLSRVAHKQQANVQEPSEGVRLPGYCGYKTLVLLEPRQEIADACLRNVLSANRPGLNHHLLATLSQLFRIDRIITTNFDDLIERAFEESRNRLDVYDVHLGDNLPDYGVISRSRCIIKLHGTRTALRADFTLESSPSASERERFRSYISGPNRRDRNHLIVFGVGLTELRTQQYILDCLKDNPSLKVFVVCFHADDIRAVERTSEVFKQSLPKKAPRKQSVHRFVVLQHGNNGLFLLHAYQWLRKSLPSSHANFPNAARLSVPRVPLARGEERTYSFSPDKTEIVKMLDPMKSHGEGGSGNRKEVIVFHSEVSVNGVGDAAAKLYREYDRDRLCVWIELHDIETPAELFEVIQEAIYRKLGETDWTPLYTDLINASDSVGARKKEDIWREEIRRIVKASPKPILLFLDARELPGCNREDFDKQQLNGWLDKPSDTDDTRADDMVALLKILSGQDPDSPSIQVVLLLLSSPDRRSHQKFGFLAKLKACPELPSRMWRVNKVHTGGESTKFCLSKRVAQILMEATKGKDHEEREHLLLMLLSMQRTRHLSVIWSRASNPDGAITAIEYDPKKYAWLEELAKHDLVMYKEGGFIWVNARLRQILRRVLRIHAIDLDADALVAAGLEKEDASEALVARLKEWNAASQSEKIHFGLANWYQLLHSSSGTSRALLESIHHIMFSVSADLRYALKAGDNAKAAKVIKRATRRINGARNLLQLHLFTIQTDGLPVDSRRRLEYVRDFWFKSGEGNHDLIYIIKGLKKMDLETETLLKSIAKIQCAAVEVIRSIDRELGEIRRASLAHQSYSIRTASNSPLPEEYVNRTINNIRSQVRGKDQTRHRTNAFSQRMSEQLINIVERNNTQELITEVSRSVNFRQKHWIRWWRWSGMIALANHNFAKAESALTKAIVLSRRPINDEQDKCEVIYRIPEENEVTPEIISTISVESLTEDYLSLIEALHAIEILASLKIRKAQALRRKRLLECAAGLAKTIEDEEDLLREAGYLADIGLRLADEIYNSKQIPTSGVHDLYWCRSRLLLAQARALIGRSDVQSANKPEDHKASVHTMSLLSNAVANLRSATAQRNNADIAFVELIRAENRLREASAIWITVGATRRRWDQWLYSRLKTEGADAEKEFVVSDGDQILSRLKARTLDALRFLDRGHPALQTTRRSLFWTTWYFQRRLNAIANLLWISVLEGNETLIPSLGPNDTFPDVESEPEQILTEAGRMIRTDAYRYACILLSYFFCVLAYQCRIDRLFPKGKNGHSSKRPCDVSDRWETLKKGLSNGLKHLDQIKEQNWPDSGKDTYEECMGDEAKQIVASIGDIIQRWVRNISMHRNL